MTATEVILSEAEIIELTGYVLHSKQVDQLRRQGFWRARMNRAGVVVLERAHYLAVCAGAALAPERTPRLRDSINRRVGLRRE